MHTMSWSGRIGAVGVLLAAGLAAAQGPGVKRAGEDKWVKWQPGHYLRLSRNQAFDTPEKYAKVLKEIDSLCARMADGYKGILLQIGWRELEPERGHYKFDIVRDALETVARHDKYMMLRVLDRSFHGKGYRRTLPEYLIASPSNYFHWKNGTMLKLWKPAIADREIALLQALAREFDLHPRLVGYITEETSMMHAHVVPESEFDQGAYAREVARIVLEGGGTFRHTPFVQAINCGMGPDKPNPYFQTVVDAVLKIPAGGLSHPDTFPCTDEEFAGRAAPTRASHYYERKYGDRIAIFPQTQANVNKKKYGPPEKAMELLVRTGVDYLGGHAMVWDPWPWFFKDGVGDAYLKAQNFRVNTSCPTGFGRCVARPAGGAQRAIVR